MPNQYRLTGAVVKLSLHVSGVIEIRGHSAKRVPCGFLVIYIHEQVNLSCMVIHHAEVIVIRGPLELCKVGITAVG